MAKNVKFVVYTKSSTSNNNHVIGEIFEYVKMQGNGYVCKLRDDIKVYNGHGDEICDTGDVFHCIGMRGDWFLIPKVQGLLLK